jgi:hypothetical protein
VGVGERMSAKPRASGRAACGIGAFAGEVSRQRGANAAIKKVRPLSWRLAGVKNADTSTYGARCKIHFMYSFGHGGISTVYHRTRTKSIEVSYLVHNG